MSMLIPDATALPDVVPGLNMPDGVQRGAAGPFVYYPNLMQVDCAVFVGNYSY